MDRQLMLSWLATQSRNAAVTPVDMYRTQTGLNEMNVKIKKAAWAGLATGMIAAPAMMAGMHGQGPGVPNPPNKSKQVFTAAQQTTQTPASGGKSNATRMPLSAGGIFDTRRETMPGAMPEKDRANLLRGGPNSKMPEDGYGQRRSSGLQSY